MDPILKPYCEDLASRIDPAEDAAFRDAWRTFLDGKWPEPLFQPPGRTPRPPKIDWPEVHINDAINDPTQMILSELRTCSNILAEGSARPLVVRPNYGTGIMPGLWNIDIVVMDREMNTLPTAHPGGCKDRIDEIIAAGVVDLDDLGDSLAGRTFATAEKYLEVFEQYPALAPITLYHPDCQGPIDVVELLWGSEIFLAFYDQPDRIKDLMNVVTETYIAFMHKWFALVPNTEGDIHAHWWMMHRGRIMLRNDSLVNLSPETYIEFVRPYDQRIFDTFQGGAIHYCGRGDHFVPPMSEMNGLNGIQLSQPHLNNMEVIFASTVDKGIPLLGMDKDTAQAALDAGRDLHHLVHANGEW